MKLIAGKNVTEENLHPIATWLQGLRAEFIWKKPIVGIAL
jgi:hypothetical protein